MKLPFKIVCLIALSTLFCELLLMVILGEINSFHGFWALLDAVFLVILLSPILYLFVYKPLSEQAKELSRKEAKFRSFFEHAGDYVLVLEPSEAGPIIVDANESACVMHGYSREELLSKPISFLDNDTKPIPERMEKIMAGEAIIFEVLHKRKDGSTFPVEVSAKLSEINGRPLIFAIERDITQRKEFEIERDKMIYELERALNEIKTLRGIIPICSHCKSIRNDQGLWKIVEEYIGDHSEVEFSHGICPDCAQEHYPEFINNREDE